MPGVCYNDYVMVNFIAYLKAFLTAVPVAILFISATHAQDDPQGPAPGSDLRAAGTWDLLALLATPGLEGWQDVEAKLRVEWARSGSHAMDLLLERAHESTESGDLAAALDHATALTDHAPQFAEGWNALAVVYFQTGAYGPAMGALERTLALNPDHYDALAGLGTILRETGDNEGALKAYLASASIHPHRPEISAVIEELETLLAGTTI